MRRTVSIIIALAALLFPIAATQAVASDEHAKRHVAKPHRHLLNVVQTDPVPQRTCSWVGPGGRAIYVCR
jgi:Ni/Co efflux regulator RcnB